MARIMPPRRFKKKSIKRIVEKHVAKAIEEYEKTRANSNNTGRSGSANTGGTVAPDVQGCSYKTFMNGKPHSFSRTEGVVGLKRWFKKMEQVFEICKCAEDDKSNVKAMMTTDYCPATEIQRMEQELWALTLKGDDIEAYNNRFHELVLMCPELVSTEKKKIEKYIRGFPEGIKGNVTSSKPATLHDAITWLANLLKGFKHKALGSVEATLGTYHGAIGARHIISQGTIGVIARSLKNETKGTKLKDTEARGWNGACLSWRRKPIQNLNNDGRDDSLLRLYPFRNSRLNFCYTFASISVLLNNFKYLSN
ncbi:putative reverse transcriptase domain-containing protein [Tanacetum coccineum]